jgi:hypothetical protein
VVEPELSDEGVDDLAEVSSFAAGGREEAAEGEVHWIRKWYVVSPMRPEFESGKAR